MCIDIYIYANIYIYIYISYIYIYYCLKRVKGQPSARTKYPSTSSEPLPVTEAILATLRVQQEVGPKGFRV